MSRKTWTATSAALAAVWARRATAPVTPAATASPIVSAQFTTRETTTLLRVVPRLAGSRRAITAAGRLRLGPVEIDERDPDLGVHHLAQLGGGLADDDLQRRKHPSLQEVTAAGRPVRQAKHDVYVHAGTVRALGDVADQRQHLALLVDGDAAMLLGRAVEPADGGAGEGTDGSDL